MSSLAHCLEKFGIHPFEQAKIRKAAKEYRSEGFHAQEANEKSVLDYVKSLKEIHKGMIDQVRAELTKRGAFEEREEVKAKITGRPKGLEARKEEITKPSEPTTIELVTSKPGKGIPTTETSKPEAEEISTEIPAKEILTVEKVPTPTQMRETSKVEPATGDWSKGESRPFAFDPNSTENEGRFRLYPTESVKKDSYFRRKSSTPGISYIMGKDKTTGEDVTQAIRFDKSVMPEEKAGQWWEENKGKFEFAEEKPKEVALEGKKGSQKEGAIFRPEENVPNTLTHNRKDTGQRISERREGMQILGEGGKGGKGEKPAETLSPAKEKKPEDYVGKRAKIMGSYGTILKIEPAKRFLEAGKVEIVPDEYSVQFRSRWRTGRYFQEGVESLRVKLGDIHLVKNPKPEKKRTKAVPIMEPETPSYLPPGMGR